MPSLLPAGPAEYEIGICEIEAFLPYVEPFNFIHSGTANLDVWCTLGAAAGRRAVGTTSMRLIESAAAESGEVRPFAGERADCSSCPPTASGESTRFKANQQRLFREYRRDQSTSNGENRGELRQAPEVGAGSTFRSDYLRSSDDRSAWTAKSTEGGSDPCGVGAPFRTPGLWCALIAAIGARHSAATSALAMA